MTEDLQSLPAGEPDRRKISLPDRLIAFAITSLARLLTGARSLWLGCSPTQQQRIYFANHSSHGDFVLLWASLPQNLRKFTRPVAGSGAKARAPAARFISEGSLPEPQFSMAPETPRACSARKRW